MVHRTLTAWRGLFDRLPELVARLEETGHPLLSVYVDGELVARLVRPSRADLEAHARFFGMPSHTPEGWLSEALSRVRHYYPSPREGIALYAGTHVVAQVRRKDKGGRHAA